MQSAISQSGEERFQELVNEYTTESDFDNTMDLNFKSFYFTVQKALPYMNDGGSVILIGSNAAHRAYPSFWTLLGPQKQQ